MRLLPWLLLALALGGVVGLSLHTRDLAERLGAAEIRLRAAERARVEAERRAAAERARLEAERAEVDAERAEAAEVERGLRASIAALEERLQASVRREQEVVAMLEERVADEQAARTERLARRDEWSRAMPEGVRLCLIGLQECLRADGYAGLRFLRAEALDAKGLRDVELLDHDPQGMASALWLAGRMTATLDRGSGRLELRFFDGHRISGGSREDLPEDGRPLVLESVDGRLWEARLPLLVRADGSYPEEVGEVPEPGVDARTRWLWQERLDALLDVARYDDLRLRVASFRGMKGPHFEGVALLGYERGNLLAMAASAERLAVEVDKRSGIVNLLLEGGTMRRKGGESAISPDGYRILLDRVTPERASDIMLGMVVRR